VYNNALTFQLLNHMADFERKKPLDATPTNYVQFGESNNSNNNMADKKNYGVGATIALLNRRL